MISSAAGMIEVLNETRAASRGNTRMWLGRLADGRFVVTSRFEYYIRTADRTKAEEKFASFVAVAP
jgi:hypothetical protein